MKHTSIAVLMLIGITTAATVQTQAKSLAQSGVVMDLELDTEVLSNEFLAAEAEAQAQLIKQQEENFKAQQETKKHEASKLESMVKDNNKLYTHRPREPVGGPDDDNHASRPDPTRSILRRDAEIEEAKKHAEQIKDAFETKKDLDEQR